MKNSGRLPLLVKDPSTLTAFSPTSVTREHDSQVSPRFNERIKHLIEAQNEFRKTFLRNRSPRNAVLESMSQELQRKAHAQKDANSYKQVTSSQRRDQ